MSLKQVVKRLQKKRTAAAEIALKKAQALAEPIRSEMLFLDKVDEHLPDKPKLLDQIVPVPDTSPLLLDKTAKRGASLRSSNMVWIQDPDTGAFDIQRPETETERTHRVWEKQQEFLRKQEDRRKERLDWNRYSAAMLAEERLAKFAGEHSGIVDTEPVAFRFCVEERLRKKKNYLPKRWAAEFGPGPLRRRSFT